MAKDGKSCLIIRTQPGADLSAQKVSAKGYSPIILTSALLQPTNDEIDTVNIQAFLVTSSNAPRLLNMDPALCELPVFAVGDATANAARDVGFKNVVSAGGDASALAVLVADRLKPQDGDLMHLRGREVAGDVKGLLSACGFEVRTTVIYETIENPDFCAKINEILSQNTGYVLFHSPKGAARFAKYANFQLVKDWSAVCISNATSIPIDEPAWAKLLIANQPNEAAMLQFLK